MPQPDLIIHDEKDNVGVVVIETTKKGQECNAWIMENDKSIKVSSINEVPLGHKIALKDLKEGDTILKYGHDIGKVVKPIKKGVRYSTNCFLQCLPSSIIKNLQTFQSVLEKNYKFNPTDGLKYKVKSSKK